MWTEKSILPWRPIILWPLLFYGEIEIGISGTALPEEVGQFLSDPLGSSS